MTSTEILSTVDVNIKNNMLTASRLLNVKEFQKYKAKEDKRKKQMLWKCGARRFKFK